MKAGDIIFVKGDDSISKIIEFFDKGRFSHVAIAISESEVLEAQWFTKSRITPFYYNRYEVLDLGLSESHRNMINKISYSLIGHYYDFIQVLSYFIKDTINKKFKVINNPNNYICSEIIEVLLQKIGVIPNEKKLRNLTPNELYNYLITLK